MVFKILFFTRKIQGYLEKWLIPKLEQEKYKTNLEHPVLPNSKETLKSDGNVKWIQDSALRGFYWPNLGQFDHQKNTDGKRRQHKPIPIQLH